MLTAAVGFFFAAVAHAQDAPVGGVFEGVSVPHGALGDPDVRASVAERARAVQSARKAAAVEQARRRGLPVRQELPDGRGARELMAWEGDQPLYYGTLNAIAAISTGADAIRQAPYLAQGLGGTVGVWDAGSIRATHQEFGGRVTIRDGAANHYHSTHVGGTIGATGIVAGARGMAPQVLIDSYDWTDDLAEMTSRGAAASSETGKIYVSNHSYGMQSGWVYTATPTWTWYGSGTTAAGVEDDFGRYNTYARDVDALAYGAPYYAIFWAAGNDRDNNPAAGAQVALSPGGTAVSYNATAHPPGDGVYRGGYETIGFNALGKNVITVGAVNDAVSGGLRDPSKATMTGFSSWGPADDGRIKPDIVANGSGLYSTYTGGDTLYATLSGTSMATPNAAGTAQQLVSYHAALFSGQYLRAATLKGLLIHTADDLGTPGPDYANGWGLVNARAAADLLAEAATNAAAPRLAEQTLTTSVPLQSHPFYWDGITPIRVTLSWTDPAGAATTTHDLRTPRLVNNLNLKVVGPDGSQHFPYVMPFVGAWTVAAMPAAAVTGTNITDNVEQVFLAEPPAAGTYQAVVSYSGTLANNQQPYSLLVTGSEPPPVEPQSVTPDEGDAGVTALTVAGTGFAPGAAVAFFRGGQADVAASVTGVTTTAIHCALDVSALAKGTWGVRVTNSDGRQGVAPAVFTVVSTLASQFFDPDAPGWSAAADSGTSYWTLTDSLSHTAPNAYFAPGPAVKNLDNLHSQAFGVPARATGVRLRFWHRYDTEAYDGCVLEVSPDNGAAWHEIDAAGSGASFVSGGYTTKILGRTGTSTKHAILVGSDAWTGANGGFSEVVVALDARYIGQTLRARWRLSTDAQTASAGWRVDSVRVTGRLPAPTLLLVR